jgi:DNA-binding NarL/FixJ family response regulator
MNKIRVMIVDDSKVIREWAGMLNNVKVQEVVLEVINEASSGQDAIKYLDYSETRPDVILMDIRFGDDVRPNGLDAAKTITHRYPTIKIVIISDYDNSSYVRKAFQSGVHGYFLKDTGKDTGVGIADLCHAIITVWNGKYFVSYRILERLIELVRISGGVAGLTDLQEEVAKLYSEGVPCKEIAKKLNRNGGLKATESRITAIRKKLDASSPQEVKQRLIEIGILSGEETK